MTEFVENKKANRVKIKETIGGLLDGFSDMTGNLYNILARVTYNKYNYKRIKLLYNLKSRTQMYFIASNVGNVFKTSLYDNFKKKNFENKSIPSIIKKGAQISIGALLSPIIGALRFTSDFSTLASNMITNESSVINLRCLPSYTEYINAHQVKISEYNYLLSFLN